MKAGINFNTHTLAVTLINMNHNDAENHMVLPAFEDEPERDEDLEFELRHKQEIDDAIEAGDHMLDQWKEDSLVNALEDIGRTAVLDIEGTNQAQ